MAIVTRCPECNTTFRVAPPQLQAQNGMVRCGRCMTVFDGFKTLSTAEDLAVPEAPQQAAAVAEPSQQQAAAVAEPGPAAAPTEPAFQLEPVSATELAAAATEPARDVAVKRESADETKDFGPAPEQLTIDDHLFLEENREARSRSARWWAIGAALLLLVLAAQAVYVYRGELAAHFPWSRPYLARMCDLLQCGVFLPQRPRLIVIEASDLQANDPARPAVIQLTATVRNHAGYDLGYPALDLVLTNTREHTLARRIFLPRDYLEPGRDVRAGIPARAEMTIRLDLDTGDLNPAGFRLDLLAAPAP
jgi:predicted Zn finger-like uncharacterized protein